jgi:thiol:disulfide interchange protein DsbD
VKIPQGPGAATRGLERQWPGQRAASQCQIADDRIHLRIAGLPAAIKGKTLELYPENADTFKHAAESGKDWQQRWDGDVWVARTSAAVRYARRNAAATGRGVALPLRPRCRPGQKLSPGAASWMCRGLDASRSAGVSPALAAALEANKMQQPCPDLGQPQQPLGSLLGGLIGGLILNLMPCVFPVLAIKVLGFSGHGQNRHAQKLSGLAYTAGVVLSFVALGALLLGLRAAGQQLGWGFQLQSPVVVSLLAALFTVLGLNLAGLFEFGICCPAALPAPRRATRCWTPFSPACWPWPLPRPARRPSWVPRWALPSICLRRRR